MKKIFLNRCIRISATLATMASLTGCGSVAPACGDTETLALVSSIAMKSLLQKRNELGVAAALLAGIEDRVAFTVSSVRTVKINEKIGWTSCEATLAVKLPEKAKQLLEHPLFSQVILTDPALREVQVDGGSASIAVAYTSQLTDDKTQQSVALSDAQSLVDFIATLATIGGFSVDETATSPSKKGL